MKDYNVSVSDDRKGLMFPGFSVVFMQTFAINHRLVFRMPSPGDDDYDRAREIIRETDLDIERQIFVLPAEGGSDNVSRYALKGFDFTMPIDPAEDEDFYPVTLHGHVDVEMNLFFGNTVSINYYFLFDNAGHCYSSSPVVTDHLIALLSTFLGAEHWSKVKDGGDKTDINLESVFRLDSICLDENGHPTSSPRSRDLSGKGRNFDEIAVLYKKFIYSHCTAFSPDLDNEERKCYVQFRKTHPITVNNDYHYAMVDIWENVMHPTEDGDLFALDRTPKLSEAEIVNHIRDFHKPELIGLLTMYPGEWPYRDAAAYDEVCGENIAIDTDDLVLVGSNLCMVLGTYGRRNGTGQGVDWEEHLKERAHYYVSWPEYLLILQMVIAKKYTIGLANDALIEATLNKKHMSAQTIIGENAQLSMRLSRMLLQLDVVKYSKFPSHKVMFDRTTLRFGLDSDLQRFNDMMAMVDSSLHNLSDYKSMKSDFMLNIILAIISCASTFELFFQQSEMPFLAYFGLETNRFAAVLVSVVAGVTIFAILLVIKNSIVSVWERIREHQ